jgi:DNA gyrase subunit A
MKASSMTVRARVDDRPINEEVSSSYLDYAMYTIADRALPDARDGLKPVQRRILYAMHEAGLQAGRPYKKCATVVGDVLGKYHPHGDSAVYDALVRMAQDWVLAEPLIDGQGNFGSIDGDNAAAYRYTESRLARAASEILADIGSDTVDFRTNYDGRLREPVVLPSRLPNLLVNGSYGIAVGMSTSLPPFNLREIAQVTAQLCDNPDVDDDTLYANIEGPDFPTGGVLVAADSMLRDLVRTGHGKIVLRSRSHVEMERGGRRSIIVTEIPYGVSKSSLIKKIGDAIRSKVVEGVIDLRDESNREGMRIVITVRRDVDPQGVLNVLYKKTPLEKTVPGIILALVDRAPRVLSVREALDVFIAHRVEVVSRKARHDLQAAEAELHIIEGLQVALANIDAVVRLVKAAESREAAAAALMKKFKLSEIQAGEILKMQLYRLTRLELDVLEKRAAELAGIIAQLQAFLADPAAQRAMVRDETLALADEYGRDRRTTIADEAAIESITEQAADERYAVAITASGRVWSEPAGTVDKRLARDDDPALMATLATGGEKLVAFTEAGFAFPLPLADVVAGGTRGRRGDQVISGMEAGDRILAVATLAEVESGNVAFVTRRGQVKKTSGEQYRGVRSSGTAAIGLNGDDRVVAVWHGATEDDEVLVTTGSGMGIRFLLGDVPEQGRSARGVRAIRLAADDEVLCATPIRGEVLVLARDGTGKALDPEQFPLQGRGGQGVRIFPRLGYGGGLLWAGSAAGVEIAAVPEGATSGLRLLPESFPRLDRARVGAPVHSGPLQSAMAAAVAVRRPAG